MARKGERDPKRERFWRAALRRQRRSGLTAREFCRGERLAETAYYYWRKELARRDREPRPGSRRKQAPAAASIATCARRPVVSPPRFHELAILGGPAFAGVEIILPDGCRVRLASEVDRVLLADVLQALEARRC
jgi:hypothetical protein